jgi:hypothetical protein
MNTPLLRTQFKIQQMEVRKFLDDIRGSFEGEEELKTWLRHLFPDPTAPDQKEQAELLCKLIKIMKEWVAEE